jgi:hypothetical protein
LRFKEYNLLKREFSHTRPKPVGFSIAISRFRRSTSFEEYWGM